MSCVPDSLQLQGVSSQSSEAILIISFKMMHAFLQSLSEVGKSVVGGAFKCEATAPDLLFGFDLLMMPWMSVDQNLEEVVGFSLIIFCCHSCICLVYWPCLVCSTQIFKSE